MAQTYILITNPGTIAADITVTFLRTDGTRVVKTFIVPPTSRCNMAVTGPDGSVPELTDESFGTIIESTQTVIVERSLDSDTEVGPGADAIRDCYRAIDSLPSSDRVSFDGRDES